MAKRSSEPRTDLRRLTTLHEISQALSSAADLRHSLERVLEKLERDHEAVRSAVMVLGADGREISIEASVGISAEGRLARYRLGEGITGRVVQSGKPIVVPAISREPLLIIASRTSGRLASSMFTRFVHASSNTSTTTPIATAVKRKTGPRIAAPNRRVRGPVAPKNHHLILCGASRISNLIKCAPIATDQGVLLELEARMQQ